MYTNFKSNSSVDSWPPQRKDIQLLIISELHVLPLWRSAINWPINFKICVHFHSYVSKFWVWALGIHGPPSAVYCATGVWVLVVEGLLLATATYSDLMESLTPPYMDRDTGSLSSISSPGFSSELHFTEELSAEVSSLSPSTVCMWWSCLDLSLFLSLCCILMHHHRSSWKFHQEDWKTKSNKKKVSFVGRDVERSNLTASLFANHYQQSCQFQELFFYQSFNFW